MTQFTGFTHCRLVPYPAVSWTSLVALQQVVRQDVGVYQGIPDPDHKIVAVGDI